MEKTKKEEIRIKSFKSWYKKNEFLLSVEIYESLRNILVKRGFVESRACARQTSFSIIVYRFADRNDAAQFSDWSISRRVGIANVYFSTSAALQSKCWFALVLSYVSPASPCT